MKASAAPLSQPRHAAPAGKDPEQRLRYGPAWVLSGVALSFLVIQLGWLPATPRGWSGPCRVRRGVRNESPPRRPAGWEDLGGEVALETLPSWPCLDPDCDGLGQMTG